MGRTAGIDDREEIKETGKKEEIYSEKSKLSPFTIYLFTQLRVESRNSSAMTHRFNAHTKTLNSYVLFRWIYIIHTFLVAVERVEFILAHLLMDIYQNARTYNTNTTRREGQ